MKKIGIGLAALVLMVGAYALGTMNARKVISIPAAEWAEGNAAAQSWREFSASLEAAGARVFAATDDAGERIEGLEYLAQMAAVSLEMKLAKGSKVNPRFTDWMGDYRKFLGDSPDAIYHTAELSPDYRYEVSGSRGDAEYIGFMLYGRQLNGWNRAAANLSSKSMRFDEAGNFTIVLSKTAPTDPELNWLKLEDDIHMIMVRQYYHDPQSKTAADFTIRNLDAPKYEPADEEEVATRLHDAAVFFNDTLDGAITLSSMLSTAPNSIDPPSSYSSDLGGVFYPTSDNEYFGGWFYLEDDEALVIEGAVPNAPYWGVSLQSRWMQSLDYKHYQIELNDHQITTKNGRYRIVVSHRQPPSGNWIDTAGKREGLLTIRYQLSQGSEKPTLTLVKFMQL
jgi:hypothetical protein